MLDPSNIIEMRLRRKFLPRSLRDIGCFLIMFTFIPITFVFEVAVVLPDFHEKNGIIYIFTCLLGLFLVFNLKANMLACMLIDTSARTVVFTPPINDHQRKYWRYCSVCEMLAPPRSWHCNTCDTCILKRDHHCSFTGSCIGHQNHRYFVFFLLYLAIGATYATVYNSIYFWWLHAETYVNWFTLIKIVFPMFMLCFDMSWQNFYLLIYMLNIIASAYSMVLIAYHAPYILRGAKDCERHASLYDLGIRRNLEMVLGKRMRVAWLTPFVRSDLPHDGIHWENVIDDTEKRR
ncbi:probable palmitoyltransferase ZDHHC24 [Ceratitis capitata]|uniref:probable palmitoyltransferase ZDHHC24 n=1 Tax=Ceratitis capitata TaxID=7213 RepID=UPI00032A3A43|nr:probable palmitoyltransferase ZDHHC24 [Ceratitis capitata]